MSGPVDVLAELDALIIIRAARAAKAGAPLTAVGDLQRAESTRAAVAELIGREELYRKTIEAIRVAATGSPQCYEVRLLDIAALSEVALANIGGAK